MVACMLETYGKSLSTYKQSNTADALDAVARNLAGKSNPGSRKILGDMKSRKKQVITIDEFFILNQSLRNGILCIVHLIPGIGPSLSYTHRKGLALVSWLPSDHAAKEKNSYRLGFGRSSSFSWVPN